MKTRDFVAIDTLGPDELLSILALGEQQTMPMVLAGKGAALLFEKPSLRTRHSMEMAVVQLGGHPVMTSRDEIGIGSRETVEDVARVLSGYHAVIAARVYEHSTVERLADAASVPVVNLLSDLGHPCQALADLLTLRQQFGALDGLSIAYVGDFNNVARSLTLGAVLSGAEMRVACPDGYGPTTLDVERVRALGGAILVTHDPVEAVTGASCVYTDVWTSMGQEDETAARLTAFKGFTVDRALMDHALPTAVFLHCLPAHRGEEVAAEVVDGPRSLVWAQAVNRMHAQRGLLMWLFGVVPS